LCEGFADDLKLTLHGGAEKSVRQILLYTTGAEEFIYEVGCLEDILDVHS